MAGPLQHRYVLATIVLSVAPAISAQTVTYSDASTADRLHGEVGVGVEEGGFSLNAAMTMVGQDGSTQVLPRVTSEWSTLEFLDVETVFSYGDWNTSDDPLQPTIDTNVLLTSGFGFVDRVEGSVRRSGTSSDETLKVRFAGLDTDLELFGGDPLGVDADVVMRDAGAKAQTSSNVTSSLGLGRSVGVKTVLRFDDGATATFTTPTIDTSLSYDSPVAFIGGLEGSLHRSSAGDVRQALGVRFPELAGEEHGSLKISGKATVEEMLHADGLESVSMGVETKVSGFMPSLLGGSNALSLRVDRQLDESEAQSSSLAYDHSWSPGDTSIGLNLKVLRRLDEVEPSMGITWNTQF